MLEPIPRQEVEDRIKEIEADNSLPQAVSERLANPHIITYNTKQWYESSDSYWTRKTKPGVIISLSVEKSSSSRALRIIDFMVKLLEARGHEFQKDRNELSVVKIYGRELHFSIRNVGKYVEDSESTYSSRNFIFTQSLCVQFYEDSWNRKEWKDTPYSKLEEKIIRVVAYAEVFAKYSCEYHKKLEEGWRIQRIEAEKRKEQERLIEEEGKKVEKLYKTAQLYDQIKQIEKYLLDRKNYLLELGLFNDEEQKYFEWGMKLIYLKHPFKSITQN